MLMPHERLAEFGSVATLLSDLSYLKYLVGSIEVRGLLELAHSNAKLTRYQYQFMLGLGPKFIEGCAQMLYLS